MRGQSGAVFPPTLGPRDAQRHASAPAISAPGGGSGGAGGPGQSFRPSLAPPRPPMAFNVAGAAHPPRNPGPPAAAAPHVPVRQASAPVFNPHGVAAVPRNFHNHNMKLNMHGGTSAAAGLPGRHIPRPMGQPSFAGTPRPRPPAGIVLAPSFQPNTATAHSAAPVFRPPLPRPPPSLMPRAPTLSPAPQRQNQTAPVPSTLGRPHTSGQNASTDTMTSTPQISTRQGLALPPNGMRPPPTTGLRPPPSLSPPPSQPSQVPSNRLPNGPPLPLQQSSAPPQLSQPTSQPTASAHSGGRYPPVSSSSSSSSSPGTINGRKKPPPPQRASSSSSTGNGKNAPPKQLNRPRSTRRPKPSRDTRIDPKQIPRPKLPAKLSGSSTVYTTRTGKGLPPEDCADFVVDDQGNASPRMLRLTANSLARSRDMMVASQIPLRAHVRPFAPGEVGDSPVPVVDFGGDQGPPRCMRCAGFINPYVKFEQDGRAWVCNLCGIVNDVERPDYVCNLDAYGRRYDIDNRPELVHGAVDFCVPEVYTIRPAQAPVYVCIVDVSYSAISSGLTKHAIESVLASLDDCVRTLAKANNHGGSQQNVNADGTVGDAAPACAPRLGIMTYDNNSLHFYDLTQDHEEPQVHVVPDVDDPFAALPHASWILDVVNPDEREKLVNLARQIPDMYTPAPQEQSRRMRRSSSYGDDHTMGCSTAAVCAALETLRQTGGRIVCFQSSIPSRGAGKLGNREDGSLYGTDDENQMFHPLPGSAESTMFDLGSLNLFGSGAGSSKKNGVKGSQRQGSSLGGRGSRSASTSSTGVSARSDRSSSAASSSGSPMSPSGSSAGSAVRRSSWSAPDTGSFYKSLAAECAASQVTVDIFTTSAGYTDIATLGQLCTVTGGRLCYYPGFSNSSENDMYCMAQDIRYSLTCARAYEAVMKVRCSKGLVCDGIMGLGVEKSTSQREVSSITEDHTWHVLLNYNADLSEEASDAFLQISFLHTNLAQQRVVRVLNFAMPIVTSLSAVFRYADVHGVCNSILREAVAESGTFARAASGYFDYTLSDIRQKMSEHGVNILYAYRQHCASNHSSGQLILPESLKFLVVFLNSIARSDYLVSNKNQGVQVSADVRAVRFVALESMPISLCIPVVYPRMMTLLDMMSGNAGNLKARKYGAPICVLPKYRYPSGTHVSDDELILLDAGTSIFLWVGLDVPSEVLVDLFGVEELPDDAAMLHPIRITRRDNDLSNRVLNVIEDHLRRHRVPSCFSDVRIVKQGSAAEDHFFNLLVEDEGPNGEPSYCAALVTAHGIIQKKMQASEY